MNPHPTIVVLSPHLDDAVLSLGAWLARTARDQPIELWTFFTDAPPTDEIAPRFRVMGDYPARRAEDARALELLAVAPVWKGLRERLWLEPPLTDTLQVFRTPPELELFPNRKQIRSMLEPLVSSGVQVVAPLGVGHHHDHVELACVALELVHEFDAFDRVWFYEDVYAMGSIARRRHFVTRSAPSSLWRSPEWRSPLLAFAFSAAALSERGPGVDRYVPVAQNWRWASTTVPVDGYEAEKLSAVAAYSSQMAAFGGYPRLAAFLRSYHRVHGGERLWRASPRSRPESALEARAHFGALSRVQLKSVAS